MLRGRCRQRGAQLGLLQHKASRTLKINPSCAEMGWELSTALSHSQAGCVLKAHLLQSFHSALQLIHFFLHFTRGT